ncbi:MAG: Rad52/Rad22 family DNA repair protein [Candidatus Sulfotelmatobacter sp.]
MSPTNGHANDPANGSTTAVQQFAPPAGDTNIPTTLIPNAAKIKELIANLEVPFHPSVIEWRVTNTSKGGSPRGQVMPYADQRAYTDRLNALLTPAGWTRRYTVHTSANFERAKDKRVVAKVLVTCELTIFGLGSHSATGEEWADNDNAGTAAEAQAFKRACSCFGLGRYLYYFTGVWVDLDERKRPKSVPQLFAWATPQGWREGQRPRPEAETAISKLASNDASPEEPHQIVREIEAMADALGKRLYRGVLKTARVWNATDIHDMNVMRMVLEQMQMAERELRRLDAALNRVEPGTLVSILRSLRLNSLAQVDNLEALKRVVQGVERAAESTR